MLPMGRHHDKNAVVTAAVSHGDCHAWHFWPRSTKLAGPSLSDSRLRFEHAGCNVQPLCTMQPCMLLTPLHVAAVATQRTGLAALANQKQGELQAPYEGHLVWVEHHSTDRNTYRSMHTARVILKHSSTAARKLPQAAMWYTLAPSHASSGHTLIDCSETEGVAVTGCQTRN